MNALSIFFRTSRSNLSNVGAHFINLCCYHSPEYQAASELRFQGGDYRFILAEGVAAK
jgi:hypothetical protein